MTGAGCQAEYAAAIEAAAQALCAWPQVRVDDREHGTATHMATDAVAAFLERNGIDNAREVVEETAQRTVHDLAQRTVHDLAQAALRGTVGGEG